MAMFRCGVNSNATEPELLWENPNPSSGFDAQTIPLDLSEYVGVIVEAYQENVNLTIQSRVYVKKNEGAMAIGRCNNTASTGGSRYINVSDSGIIVSHCIFNTVVANNNCVLARIYGVKNDAQIGNSNLGGKTLLWTNPNLFTLFNSQDINLDLSKYSAVIITTRYNNVNQSYSDNYLDCYAEKDKTTLIGGYYPSGGFCTTRNATVSNTKVSFGNGYFQTNADNNQCIPYKIYGIR